MNFRLWLEGLDKSGAYWISPQGTIMPMNHYHHIESIIKDPELFGFTKEQIEETYEKYGEKPGVEGKARGEIMTDAMNRGWIRIRKYSRPDFYSVQTGRYGASFRNRLADWVIQMIETGNAGKYSELRITPFDPTKPVERYEFIDFLRKAA
jgi:hypothetical protein